MNATITLGMPVDVYHNDHEDTMSIRSRLTDTYGRVLGHGEYVAVSQAEFVIQPGGQQRARESGVKNPHAFVRGHMALFIAGPGAEPDAVAVYNPTEHDTFVDRETGEEIHEATVAVARPSGVEVYNS